jgi:cytochrome c-type biogenesis protein
MAQLTIFIAFAAGILSFLSPCILPIIPGFMAFLSGRNAEYIPGRKETFLSSLFFVLGFSLVFALLGILLNTVLASSSYAVRTWLGRIGGAIIIVFALHILGLIKIPFLMMDHKIEVKKFKTQYVTAFMFGASFAVGWSPCVGAILGSVFALAITQPAIAFVLLMAYALGLGIPFLIIGVFTDKAVALVKRSHSFLKYFNSIVGILLLAIGVLVFTDNLNLVANFFVPAAIIR